MKYLIQNSMRCDVLIIGSGIAGLTTAWKLAKSGLHIVMITKKSPLESNTYYAQGGIAAVVSSTDNFDLHTHDTLIAGDGLCDEKIVQFVVQQGPSLIQELITIGIQFSSQKGGKFDLGREGGHSKRRILHVKDRTGREIQQKLLLYCKNFDNVQIEENHLAIDIALDKRGKAVGAYVFDIVKKSIMVIYSEYTVLATGGASRLYSITSNPDIATGDGIAMAYRAGASISNMEFVQFHPTCLYTRNSAISNYLISEAVRGEGAILLNCHGQRFMSKYDSRNELAPRDIVSRAIFNELKRTNSQCVFLDISHKESKFVKKRFPNIYKHLLENNLDLTKDKIPVIPAAHYMCGGVKTDINGETNISNLYCIGESSCTGLHGANRLASNSLLEALVFAHTTANQIKRLNQNIRKIDTKEHASQFIKSKQQKRNKITLPNSIDQLIIPKYWTKIQSIMTNFVGIERDNNRLKHALKQIQQLKIEINTYISNYKLTSNLILVRNVIDVAELIIRSALTRKESRGTHYSIDFPKKNSNAIPTILKLNKVNNLKLIFLAE